MQVIEIVNLLSSLASLILSVLAIWLALHFYDKGKDSERQTEVNVNEIRTQTAALHDISSRMLDKYTDYATQPKAADESFLIVSRILGQITSGAIPQYPDTSGNREIESYAVRIMIVALFYAGATNLEAQDLLPNSRLEIEEGNSLPSMLDASHQDFMQLISTLESVDSSLIEASELASLLEVARAWHEGGNIKGMQDLYVAP